MLKSYFRIALRNLSNHKLTSFINIFGLGLSMSVGLMIMIRLQDQFSFDKFHPSSQRIYRVTSEYQKKNERKWKMASTALPLMDELVKNSNTIDKVASIYPAMSGKAFAEGKEIYINGAFTQPAFFDVFGFALQAGNPTTALQSPNCIVVNRLTAEKFFGTANALGKVLKMENGTSFLITGVLKDPQGKSHIDFDAYASYSTVAQLEKSGRLPGKLTDKFAFNAAYTYVLLRKDANRSAVKTQLASIANEMNILNTEGVTAFNIQGINDITPGTGELNNDLAAGISWSKIYVEAGMALLILLAACFNYTNLTIAKSLTRAKEVGIRKIVGAKRSQVFIQYIFESVLLSLLSLGFSWILLSLIVQYAPFNDDYEFIPSTFRYNVNYVCWSLVYAVFTGLLAGSSPAWILSAFTPLRVLKNLSTAKIMGRLGLQKTLIVFQYSLSLVLMIFLFVFYQQFSYLGKADTGFTRHNVLVVPLNNVNEKIAAQQLEQLSDVEAVAASSAIFTKRFNGANGAMWISNKQEALGMNYYYANEKFIPQMKLTLVAGRNFSTTNSAEDKERDIILTEAAVRAFGFPDNNKALGQKLWVNDSTQLEITGVLKDFMYEGAGRPIRPLAFRNNTKASNVLYVQTSNADKATIKDHVKSSLSNLIPAAAFNASWLEEDLDKANAQTATISLLGFLGFIAVAIASLGLLGIVVYTVEVKGKEISIRKVLGASEKQVINILSKGFIKLLLIAGLIAMPIGWLLGTLFLQNFNTRINFGFINVMFCFLFLLGIGLFTIMSQTYKAAITNPVKNLRTD